MFFRSIPLLRRAVASCSRSGSGEHKVPPSRTRTLNFDIAFAARAFLQTEDARILRTVCVAVARMTLLRCSLEFPPFPPPLSLSPSYNRRREGCPGTTKACPMRNPFTVSRLSEARPVPWTNASASTPSAFGESRGKFEPLTCLLRERPVTNQRLPSLLSNTRASQKQVTPSTGYPPSRRGTFCTL